jgi:2-phosphosulfolactate phosphatase
MGLDGASAAEGTAVVIDTLRAFSTAAYLLAAGAREVVVTATIDDALAVAATRPGVLLCGEDRGFRPAAFDLGNSPGEVVQRGGLDGASVVQRTSSGTRCVLAAITAGAAPVYAASLVVASATAAAVAAADAVTIVASGRGGKEVADEDEVTADYIESVLAGAPVLPDLARIIEGEPGDRFRSAPWAHRDDLELCLAVDRFTFAMRAEQREGLVHLLAIEPGCD